MSYRSNNLYWEKKIPIYANTQLSFEAAAVDWHRKSPHLENFTEVILAGQAKIISKSSLESNESGAK